MGNIEDKDGISEQVLIALRRIMRAVDIHSRRMVQKYNLTGPQLMIMREISRCDGITMSRLAQLVSLSNPTLTGIIDRLEKRDYLRRCRDQKDRRQIRLSLTEAGLKTLVSAPPLLQEKFMARLQSLENWEKAQLLSSLERIGVMMDAVEIDASPILDHQPLNESDGKKPRNPVRRIQKAGRKEKQK